MPKIPDDIGRLGNFTSVDFEQLKKAITSAVGDAVKFNSESKSGGVAKEDLEKLIKALSDMTDKLSDVKENIRDNIKSTEEFVEQIKKASVAEKPKRQEAKSKTIEDLQQTILRQQQKASADKVNKFTTGGSVLQSSRPSVSTGSSFQKIMSSASKAKENSIKANERAAENILESIARTFSLKSLGFKPKGTDKIPAMLSAGEYVVPKREAQGYEKGGFVKPQYLANGSGRRTGYRTIPEIIPKILERIGIEIHPTIGPATNVEQAYSEAGNIGHNIANRFNDKFQSETSRNMASFTTGMSNMLLGGGANFFQNIFQGSVTDATEFRQDIRKLAYELEGVGKQERALQKGFFELGNIAKETGKRAEVMQRVLLSNVKKGLKNNVETKKVMKSSLYLSTMIGSNAEQTADMFGDWYRILGMGADQMSRLANDSRLLARSTGITGDELIAVMKASEGILKNLRNQGNLTNTAAKNIIEAMAQAKKLGIEQEAGKIMDAMTSSVNLLTETDEKTRRFVLGIAGRGSKELLDATTSGTITKDPRLMKEFSGQMNQFINQMTQNMVPGGVKNAQEAMEILSDKQKQDLSLGLKGFAGMDLYSFDAFGKSLNEASKSLGERLSDLDKEMSSPAATAEEKQAVERKKQDILMTSAFGNLQSLGSELKKGLDSGQNFNQVLQKSFDKLSQGEKENIKTLESSLSSKDQASLKGLSEPMRAQMVSNLAANKALQEAAKAQGETVKDFGPEIQAALRSGDVEKYRESVSEMDKAMKGFNVNDKMAADPMTELSQSINELNGTIRNKFSSLTGSITDFIGAFTLFGIQVGLMIGTLYFTFGRGMSNLIGGIRGLKLVEGFDNLALQMATGPGEGIFKNFFKTYAKTRTGAGDTSVLKSLGKATHKLGNNMRSVIFNSLDTLEAGAPRVFGSIGEGIRKVAIETRKFYGGLFRGFRDARKAGQGFFRSIGAGLTRGYGGLFKTIGKSNTYTNAFTNSFVKGFSKARKSGDGFLKAFTKGLKKAGFAREAAVLRRGLGSFSIMLRNFGQGIRKLGQGIRKLGQGIRKSIPMLDAFIKGFSRARAAGKGFFRAFIRGFSGMIRSINFGNFATRISSGFTRMTTGISSGLGRFVANTRKIFSDGIVKGITKIFSDLGQGIRKSIPMLDAFVTGFSRARKAGDSFTQAFSRGFSRSMRSGIGGITKIFSGGIGGLTKIASGGFRGLASGARLGMKGLRAALLAGTGGTIQVIFTAIDAIFGAVSGFMNTGKNFQDVLKGMGKSANEVTWGMYAASTISGALVGILDGLTFGLLRFTGIAEGLEKFLSWTLYGAFALIEGVAAGVYEAFKMVGSAFAYLGKQFSGIGQSILKIFNSIMGVFGGSEAKTLGEVFGRMLPYLKVIGKAIGFIVGLPIAAALWVVVKSISAVIMVIEILANAIAGTINVITSFVKAIGMILTGDFSGAFKLVGGAIYDAVTGIFSPIVNFIISLGNDIIAPFKWLYNILVGNSIIPDLCIAIVSFFGKMALNIIKGLGSLMFKITKFFVKLPFKLMKGMFNFFVKWPLKLFGKMINLLTGGLFGKGLSVLSSKVGEFFTLFQKYLWDFGKIAFQSWYKLINWISGGWLDKIVKGISGLGGKIVNLVDDYLIKPISSAFQKIATLVDDFLIKPITNLIQKVMSYLPKWATGADDAARAATNAAKIGSKAATAADDVAKGAVKATEVATKGTTLVDDAAKIAISGADDVVKAGASGAGTVAGKAAGGLAKKIPILGPAIDFTIRKTLLQQDTTQAAGGAIAGGVGGLAGAAAGAATGTMIGAALAPFTAGLSVPVGAILGGGLGLAGGILGGIGGGMLWDAGYESVTGKGEEALKEGVGPTMVEQGDAQLAQGEVISTTMQMAQQPGSMYVHDTHIENVLLLILEELKGGSVDSKSINKISGALAEASVGKASSVTSFGNKLSEMTMNEIQGTRDTVDKANLQSREFNSDIFENGPKVPASAYLPIKIPEKNPEFMKSMNVLQKEISRTGMSGLIPSSKSSENITGLEDKTMNAIESNSILASTPVGHAIPVARTAESEDEVGGVQPVHLRDITESILRDKTSAQAGTNKLQSDELSRMEEVANQQVSELMAIKEGIHAVVQLLTPRESIAGASPEQMASSTKDPRRPLHAAAFGKMKYARAGGLANRSVINNGEC